MSNPLEAHFLKKLVAAVLTFTFLISVLQLRVLQATLIGWYLPEFPQPTDVVTRLSGEAEGAIHFASASPFDLDVVFSGMQGVTPTTGLVRPRSMR